MDEQTRTSTPCAWIPSLCVAALSALVAVGSATAAVSTVNPKDLYGDPFGINPDGIQGEAEVPGVGDKPGPTDIPLDMRGHSDVPDLPDSGDDGGASSSSNIGSLFPDDWTPGLVWDFEDSVGDFNGVDPLVSINTRPFVAPSTSPVPTPGGLVALGIAGALSARRRRR